MIVDGGGQNPCGTLSPLAIACRSGDFQLEMSLVRIHVLTMATSKAKAGLTGYWLRNDDIKYLYSRRSGASLENLRTRGRCAGRIKNLVRCDLTGLLDFAAASDPDRANGDVGRARGFRTEALRTRKAMRLAPGICHDKPTLRTWREALLEAIAVVWGNDQRLAFIGTRRRPKCEDR